MLMRRSNDWMFRSLFWTVWTMSTTTMLFSQGFAPVRQCSRGHEARWSTMGEQNNVEILIDSRYSTRLYKSSSSFSSSSKSGAKRKKNKMKKTRGNFKSGTPLSSQELAEHVSNEYMHGPGGMLRDKERKRKRLSQQYQHMAQHMAQQAEEGLNSPPTTSANNRLEQERLLRDLDRHPALVLNADFMPLSYLPLSLWHWQEAVKAVFSGKVQVVDVYPDVSIRAANLHVPLPSVIALTEYVRPPALHHKPAFTKRNVFLRDEYRCQYCNDMFHTRDLSLDHVVPRCRGGHLNWENAVTCCTHCNGKKGSLGLKELHSKFGMKLRNSPRVPTQYELAMTASRMLPRQVHPTWEPYLPYHQPPKSSHQEEHIQPHQTRHRAEKDMSA